MKLSRRALVVVAILLSMFMSAMEATVVATAMPTVIADLQGIELYGWVASIYTLAMTVTIPLWGSFADLRGRRPAMLAGLFFFLLGSVLSGASTSMLMLVVARAVQGVGAGALQPVSLTIVGDLFTVEERGRVQGAFGAVWAVAGVAGPLLGGLIVHALSWRWVFYINLPFGLLSAVALVAFYHEDRVASRKELRVDVAGAALLTVCVLALLLGVGGRWPAVTLPLSGLSLVAFLAVERRAREPIVPLSLFGQREIAVTAVASALMGAVMMSTLIFLPLYAQASLGASPTIAGTTVAPMLIAWPVSSTITGRMLPRVGPRPLVRGGLALVALGTLAVWLLVRAHGSVHALRVAMLVFGAGMGFANTALIMAVQESVGHARRGVVTASALFFRSIGGALSVGALGALLAHELSGVVEESRLNALLGPERGRSLDARTVSDIAAAVAHGMQPLFALTALAGALAAASGMLFPDVKLGARASMPPAVAD